MLPFVIMRDAPALASAAGRTHIFTVIDVLPLLAGAGFCADLTPIVALTLNGLVGGRWHPLLGLRAEPAPRCRSTVVNRDLGGRARDLLDLHVDAVAWTLRAFDLTPARVGGKGDRCKQGEGVQE